MDSSSNFQMEISLQLFTDVETLKHICQYKEDQLRHSEDEIKFKKNTLVGNIKEALTDFVSIKYTLEKGFFLKYDERSEILKDLD